MRILYIICSSKKVTLSGIVPQRDTFKILIRLVSFFPERFLLNRVVKINQGNPTKL